MANNASTQGPSGGATIIDRRRFLKQTALATAVVSVPYLAGKKTVAFGKEGNTSGQGAKGADAALDRALKELVAMEGGPPGVIAVVQRGRHREVHTFGVRNIKSGLPLRVDDRMRIASAAKAFSGAVALSLVSKGALSLNTTIGELLSEDLPDPPPDTWSEVTLRQLLNHTSGLPDFTGSGRFQDAVRANPTQPDPPEKLITYAYDLNRGDLLFTPGTQYKYSNSDNIVVGLMVEAATGRTYESQLQEQVFGPLGLRKTSLPVGPNIRKPYIHGYDLSVDPPEDGSKAIAAGWAWASGGIVSTPADINTFIRAYVRGDLFDLQTRSKQRKVIEGGGSEPPGPGKNSAGLALFRYETSCGTVWGHTGNIPGGYTQFMAASPDGKRSATVSINSQLSPPSTGDQDAFRALRRAEGLAVCAALAGS
ncbi:MAG TPA: serine hydrolase domain-containing protein [Rubrobacter sp.]|nr:serine hydrolase domain-containing protein [Rubrobacter sp.]HEX5699674.1 serine hydrolase domain-containing protein [Rubrobacter sp.]